jgi:hypothetical protein
MNHLLCLKVISKQHGEIFNHFANENISFHFFDYRIWLLLISIGLITGFISGSYPAFLLSRFKTIKVLKGTTLIEKRGAGLRKVLVTVQFIISIFLIIGTIVIYKQISYVKDRPVGYDQENLVDISATGDLPAHFDIFKNELSKIPHVLNVAAGDDNVVQFAAP